MTYQEQIKHPKWQKKRLEIMQRDNFTCQICGAEDKTLNVHHRLYWNTHIWEYPNSIFITLCEDCHNISHTSKKDNDNNHFYNSIFNMLCYQEKEHIASLIYKILLSDNVNLTNVKFIRQEVNNG